MSSEVSLVEITMYKYQKDDTEYGDFLNNELDLTCPNWENITVDFEPEYKHDENVKFIQDGYGFQFNFFGETFNGHWSSGLDYEYHECFGGEMFEGFESALIECCEKLINEFDAKQEFMKNPQTVKIVRFITIWEYNTFHDTYNNEFDSDWNLLGLVRINDIESLIDKESK